MSNECLRAAKVDDDVLALGEGGRTPRDGFAADEANGLVADPAEDCGARRGTLDIVVVDGQGDFDGEDDLAAEPGWLLTNTADQHVQGEQGVHFLFGYGPALRSFIDCIQCVGATDDLGLAQPFAKPGTDVEVVGPLKGVSFEPGQ